MLATQALTRRFGGLIAVRDVSISLHQGELHAVIGPNGAGKTTLVNMLSGEIRPTAGRIELDPVDDGCVLRFTCLFSDAERASRDAAGWHVCLDLLERHLGGAPAHSPSTDATPEWRALYDEYQRRGLPAGAPLPGA